MYECALSHHHTTKMKRKGKFGNYEIENALW